MSPLSVEVWIYIMTAYLAVSLILYAISRLVHITCGIAHIAYMLKYGSMTISGLVRVKRGITCGNTWHNTWHWSMDLLYDCLSSRVTYTLRHLQVSSSNTWHNTHSVYVATVCWSLDLHYDCISSHVTYPLCHLQVSSHNTWHSTHSVSIKVWIYDHLRVSSRKTWHNMWQHVA